VSASHHVSRAAEAAAPVSIAAAGTSWFASANEIVSFVASGIAIVAGVFAIAVHLKNLRRK
jgi:hypothetical protein